MESQTPEDDTDDNISSKKIRRIHNAIENRMPIEAIESLLQTEGDINYDIFEECGLQPNLLSAATYYNNFVYFDLLLKYGADFIRKDKEGRTVVHEHIDFHPRNKTVLRLVGNFKNEFVNAILSAHVKYNVAANPCDENGISHFHVACITNDVSVVNFFLENGVDVDQAVNENSLIFPLDTPLHLAAKYASAESMEILLKYGANVRLKNTDGLTPLHVLVDICKFGLELLTAYEKTLSVSLKFEICDVNGVDEYGFIKLHGACILGDEDFVGNILEKTENIDQAVNLNSPICSGYTALHFAAFTSVEIFKSLLEKGANIEVKNGRGATPIDLFLQKYGAPEMHSILLSRSEWRNIVLSDNKTKLTDVVSAMETADEFILFLNTNKSALTLQVPLDSPLWPGYTLLHLSVIFTIEVVQFDPTKIVECLKRGSDMTATDAKGSTALHLAFYLDKRRVVEYLLNHHDKPVNSIDKHNLSHFHIACAARHRKSIERFLSLGVDINSPVLKTFDWIVEQDSRRGRCINPESKFTRFFICPGSTALHINVASGDVEITKLLLKHGAKVQAKDINGFTPVHRLLTSAATDIADLLLSVEHLDNCIANGGLSHLHVASHFDHSIAVGKLIEAGANIDADVTYKRKSKKLYHDDLFDPYGDYDEPLNFLFAYRNYTPLHLVIQKTRNVSTICLLIDAGADFLKKTPDGTCLFQYLSPDVFFQIGNPIFSMLKKSKVLQEYFERQFGWTKLQLACCTYDIELVRRSTTSQNVNAKIHSNCPVWRGYTPLHVIANMGFRNENRNAVDICKKIVRLLIKNGADLTLTDDNGDTPLHLHPLYVTPFLNFLFECLKSYNVNPTNHQGTSLFHIACATRNVRVVEKFLKHGVDVNQGTNYFSACWGPGGMSLHLVIWYYEYSQSSKRFLLKIGFSDDSIIQIVDKLIQNGADVNAIDAFGETPLFGVTRLKKFRRVLIPKLISNGADVQVTNVYGNTPFELLLNTPFKLLQKNDDVTWDEIELFLKAGCHLNTFNPVTQVGYIAVLFHRNDLMKNQIRFKIGHHQQVTEINDAGCTAIHNIVSIPTSTSDVCIAEMIEQLTTRGCDIDHQDNEGKTALHLAIIMGNRADIWTLLKNGADVNLTDNNGRTFISYVCEPSDDRNNFWSDSQDVMIIFTTHIYKLGYCGLPVNKQNKRLYVESLKKYPLENSELKDFRSEIEKLKNINIDGTSLSLYQFLIDAHVDVVYRNMTNEESQKVDRFFQSIGGRNFLHVDCLLRLKYRRVIQRIKLIEPALESFSLLIKYQLPELCCRNILRFLNNEDLKNLVALAI